MVDIYDVAVGCVEDNAFQGKNNIKSIYFPSAQQVGLNAFRNCPDLEIVRLPTLRDPNLIGVFAFNSPRLKYIDLGLLDKNQVKTSDWGISSGSIVVCRDGILMVD